MKALIVSCAGLLVLTGCASANLPSLTGAGHMGAAAETFTYKTATDGHVRVDVEGVQTHGQADFLPTDPNWVQIRIRVTNTTNRTVNLTGCGEKLANGSVVRDAQTGSDIVRPPSVGKMLLMSSGGLAASLLFPPALIFGVAADVAMPFISANKLEHVAERVNREGMKGGPLAPGTSVSGLIFVPAVTGQTGLVLFYNENGSTQSVTVPRSL